MLSDKIRVALNRYKKEGLQLKCSCRPLFHGYDVSGREGSCIRRMERPAVYCVGVSHGTEVEPTPEPPGLDSTLIEIVHS